MHLMRFGKTEALSDKPAAPCTEGQMSALNTLGNEEKTFVQWELQEIPTCRLYRLGFTKEEVCTAIDTE